jgi:hypothetical protein
LSVEITPELIDRLVVYFGPEDDPEDPARLWQGLCFMEQQGIDFSMRSAELIGYLTSSSLSPVPGAADLTDEDLRRFVLAIRDKVRETIGLPPLSEEEKNAWRFVPRPGRLVRAPYQRQSKVYGVNFGGGLDPVKVARRVGLEDPELVRVLRLFAEYNLNLPKDSPSRLSLMWIRREVQNLIILQNPEIGAIDALELSDWLEDNILLLDKA